MFSRANKSSFFTTILLLTALILQAVAASHNSSQSEATRQSQVQTLIEAAMTGDITQIRVLIAAGADLNAASANGKSALIFAAEAGHTNVVKLLLEAGARVNGYDRTALMFASEFGRVDIVRLLLEAGAEVNAQASNGVTALMYAAANGHSTIVDDLIAAGADLGKKDREGNTALLMAEANRYEDIAQKLRDAGARLNKEDEDILSASIELAERFVVRLQETRDFAPLLDELFISGFPERCQAAVSITQESHAMIAGLVPLTYVNRDLASRFPDELRRYFIAMLNLNYLKFLHLVSTFDLESGAPTQDTPPEKQFAPGVFAMLMSNPEIARAATEAGGPIYAIASKLSHIKTIEQLRSILPTLEAAVVMQRNHVANNSPETKAIYKKNSLHIGKGEFLKPAVFLEEGIKSCDPPARMERMRYVLIKVPPFYRLLLAQGEDGLKIFGLTFTEPPVID